MLPTVDDIEHATVLAAMGGDRGSFDELATLWRPRLMAAVRGRVADAADAEDVAQQALARAWEKRSRFRPGARLGPWLLTIAYRLAADRRRAAGRRRHHEGLAAGTLRLVADPAPDAADVSELWTTVRDTLDGDAYSMVWLVYREGLAVREAARVLGRSAGSARVLLHRARSRLAEPLAAWNDSAVPPAQNPCNPSPVGAS